VRRVSEPAQASAGLGSAPAYRWPLLVAFCSAREERGERFARSVAKGLAVRVRLEGKRRRLYGYSVSRRQAVCEIQLLA